MIDQKKPLRFGLLLDSSHLKNWQIRCLENLIKNQDTSFELCIVNAGKSQYTASKLPLGFRYLERKTRKSSLFQSTDISNLIDKVPQISIVPHRKKGSNYLEPEDLEKIKSHQLDFILRFGFGILKGEILHIPRYGVWSFHHGNPANFRGGPPSFWELFQGKRTQGIILQQLTEELDAGILLYRANLALVQHSYRESLERSFELSSHFPSWTVNKLIQEPEIKFEKIDSKGPIYRVPSSVKVCRFLFQQFLAKLKFHLSSLFLAEIWNIGIAEELRESQGRKYPDKIQWAAPLRSGEYLADPFWNTSMDAIYAERYSYKKAKGLISKLSYRAKKFGKPEDLNLAESHLSYPSYLRIENREFLLPENYASNEIKAFELSGNTSKEAIKILDGDWLDPTLYQHKDNTWYLFVSPKSHSNEMLYLFYADQAFGTFTAHPQNPIKIDIQASRPAGPLFINKDMQLIRPAQNSANGYGSSVVLNEVLELSKTSYKEQKIDEIFPNKNTPFPDGLHTLSEREGRFLIDSKRLTFVYASFVYQLQQKIQSLFKA